MLIIVHKNILTNITLTNNRGYGIDFWQVLHILHLGFFVSKIITTLHISGRKRQFKGIKFKYN